MAAKNLNDAVAKASMMLLETMKDVVATNVVTAMRNKQVDIKPEQAQTLLTIIAASLEEGYSRGMRGFTKTVDQLLSETTVATKAKKKSL